MTDDLLAKKVTTGDDLLDAAIGAAAATTTTAPRTEGQRKRSSIERWQLAYNVDEHLMDGKWERVTAADRSKKGISPVHGQCCG